MQPQFKVGDIVHIVDEPVGLASTWVGAMTRFCGCEAVITYAVMHKSGNTGVYRIRVTNSLSETGWQWNDEAFKEFYVDPVAVSDDDLLSLLGVM